MKRIVIFFLAIGFCASAFSSGVTDSLRLELAQSTSDSVRFEILNQLIKANLWNDNQQSLHFAELYDSIAQNNSEEFYKGKGKNFQGMCYYIRGDIDVAINYYLQAIQHFEQAKDSLFVGILYNNIGAAYKYREKDDETIKYYKKALEYFYAINDEPWINRVNVNLAILLAASKRYDEAIAYDLEAMEYFRAIGDHHTQGSIMANIGAIYFTTKKYQKCINISKEAMEYVDIDQDATIILMCQNNIAISYLRLKQPYKAKEYIDKAMLWEEKYEGLEFKKTTLGAMSEFYELTGDYEKALLYYKDYEVVKDSFFNEVKDQAVVEATTKYETEKKEQEIKLLNTTTENQQLKIAQSKRQSNFFILGIIGLSLLALVLFYAFRTKQKLLSEKELLLKEIHHRVKNNLQIVTSLLNIQERRITDQEAIAAIKESKTRVESMALIHQSLYQNNDLSNVNAKDYVQQLITYIFNTYKVNQDKVDYQLEIEKLQMDLDTLIPLGLIINELVSNALKHAFKAEDKGMIRITMNRQAGKVLLKVSDNGVGLPADDVLRDSNSFGFRMINAFVKKLNASIDIIRKEGTMMKIAFDY